ncbi:hypothetical protein B9G69_013535 [Bdellovibrio sp. SKB1291214]|uniref:hypothetical protein n=1 Tax=Bdellovibrio sp. SKB1291214 TaxID=1732569 RepID=UPI000B5180E6|nr:hypothetical protein [Bdellovibrio sp. SKB1291214]UYL08067.1 hypothetical protein B9G69_013535 [Bdellovibrio sp. SKB1291214]
MKQILMSVFALLIAQSASAMITQNSSWEEILAAKGPYVLHSPVIYMGRAIDYTFVCRDGGMLRTQAPVDIVYAIQEGAGKTVFQTVGREVLSTPINYVQKEDFCDTGSNRTVCKPVTYTGTYPMTVNIQIGRRLNNGLEVYLFTKSYTVPTCENVVAD